MNNIFRATPDFFLYLTFISLQYGRLSLTLILPVRKSLVQKELNLSLRTQNQLKSDMSKPVEHRTVLSCEISEQSIALPIFSEIPTTFDKSMCQSSLGLLLLPWSPLLFNKSTTERRWASANISKTKCKAKDYECLECFWERLLLLFLLQPRDSERLWGLSATLLPLLATSSLLLVVVDSFCSS